MCTNTERTEAGRELAADGLSAMGGDQPVLVDELQKLGQLPLVFVVDVIEASTLACYTQLSWRRQ